MRNGGPAVEAKQQVAFATEVRDKQLEEGVDDEALGLALQEETRYLVEVADGVDEERRVERVQRDEGG